MSVINSYIPDSVTVGDFTTIGKDTSIGDNTRISSHCNIYGATIGENCMIGAMVEAQKDSYVGDSTRIQSHSFICSGTEIGDNVFCGHGLMTCNDKFNGGEIHYSSNEWGKIVIEDFVKIGNGVTILPNVTIGKYSVIGAGSVVTSNIPEYAVAYGNPARVKYFLKDKK